MKLFNFILLIIVCLNHNIPTYYKKNHLIEEKKICFKDKINALSNTVREKKKKCRADIYLYIYTSQQK